MLRLAHRLPIEAFLRSFGRDLGSSELKPNMAGGTEIMSFQNKLNEQQNNDGGSVDGNVDATKHKCPMQVLECFIQNAPRGSKAIYC